MIDSGIYFSRWVRKGLVCVGQVDFMLRWVAKANAISVEYGH